MRIYIRGFDTPYTYRFIEKIAVSLKPEGIVFIHDPQHYPDRPRLNLPAGIDFEELNVEDVVNGHLGFPEEDAETLSKEFIHEHLELEMTAVRLMDRIDQRDFGGHIRRKHYYLMLLRSFRHLLKIKKITHFISHALPHHPIDFIPYELSRRAGLSCVYFERTPVLGTVYLAQDWREEGLDFFNRAQRIKADASLASSIELRKDFEDHFKMQTGSELPKYFHIDLYHKQLRDSKKTLNKIKGRLADTGNKIRNLLDHPKRAIQKYFTVDFWYLNKYTVKKETLKLHKYYQSISIEADLTKKYVYFPLHLQPEATTCPQGDVFVDQQLAIRIISASIPKDWLIYVKEYPGQLADGRNIGFYKDLLELKNLRFVKVSTVSAELIASSQAVATITGTAGWEALFRGKPVLFFGHCYYQYAPGVFKISSEQNCRAAIKAFSEGAKPNLHDLRIFLKAIQDGSIIGYVEPRFGQANILPAEENSENLARAYVDFVRSESNGLNTKKDFSSQVQTVRT